MQQEEADDYVLATGEMHSVREFVEKSFAITGITIQWKGKDVEEVGLNAQSGKTIVRIDRKFSSLRLVLHQVHTNDAVITIQPNTSDLPKSSNYLVIQLKHRNAWAGRERSTSTD